MCTTAHERRLSAQAATVLATLFLLVALAPVAATTDREGRNSAYFTVCGDPNNLPFSNDRMEGFENRIAQIIAEELDRPLHYRWWPQTVGFVRNTLKIRLCDLIMGITSVNELVQNTNPYYRSVYSLVYRPDVGYRIQSLSDPSLKDLSIGVVAGTPPATLLARYGLMGQTRPYLRTVDTRRYSPASDAVQAVATRDLDLAIIWGPIAGYAASQYSPPLRVVPLPALVDNVPLAFSVSMGVRDREKQWKHQINEIIARIEPRINAVLASFGVPLLDANNRPIEPQDAREAP